MKPLVIYHDNCADGFGAAYAAWTVLGDDAEYLPLAHGLDYALPENTFEFKDRDIYILDFSFPKNIMEMLQEGCSKFVWLDHHKTAFDMWCVGEANLYTALDNKRSIVLDNEKSGAVLAWEYFRPCVDLPELLSYIDDYDRWKFKYNCTRSVNKALWAEAPWSFSRWGELVKEDSDCDHLWTKGSGILQAHNQNVITVIKGTAMPCEITLHQSGMMESTHFTGLMSNCPPHLSSDVGHELANQSGTFGLLWSVKKDGTLNCSLRSNGEYDVSIIAKAFGGGGHKNAAGFSTDIKTLISWMRP